MIGGVGDQMGISVSMLWSDISEADDGVTKSNGGDVRGTWL